MNGQEDGETNRWLVGIMGAVGGLMVLIVVGFQAQIDARQDDVMRENARVVDRVNSSTEKIADRLGEVTVELARIQARNDQADAIERGRRK